MGTENKKKTNYRCKIHVMRLKSSSIHFPSTAPTFLSLPQGIQGHTMATAAHGLTSTQKCFGWSAPARSALTSAEPEQKICSDCVFPGTRLTLQTAFGTFLRTQGPTGV